MTTPTSRRETPHRSVALLVTGQFTEGPGYAVWRPQGTSDYLLMWTQAGQGRIGFAGGEHRTQPGELTLLSPGTLHDYGTDRSARHWEFCWTHFLPRPHWIPWLDWPEAAPGIRFLSATADKQSGINEAVTEMHHWASSGQPRRDEWAMNALERALLLADTVNPHRAEAHIDARVRCAMIFLRENLREPLFLPDLARMVGLSPSRLSHLFRAETGQTPQQFQEQIRLQRAQQLLSLTGRSIAAIAEEVGYDNPFYFTLRFKKRMGVSPSAWRTPAATLRTSATCGKKDQG